MNAFFQFSIMNNNEHLTSPAMGVVRGWRGSCPSPRIWNL